MFCQTGKLVTWQNFDKFVGAGREVEEAKRVDARANTQGQKTNQLLEY